MFLATYGFFLERASVKRWVPVFLLAWGFLEMGEIALAHDDKVKDRPLGKASQGAVINTKAPAFSLTEQNGSPFSLANLQGRVVAVTFIYTSCVDACPLLTAGFAALQRKLKEKGQKEVFLLSITTDPEIDRPEVLKSYAERYGADLSSWAFLSGRPEILKQVWRDYGVRVRKQARGLVNHTFLTVLIDQAGVLRRKYFGSVLDVDAILKDIDSLKGGES